MNILIILLGCHISLLLNDRVNTAIQYLINIEQNELINIDWFLSGGIKYHSTSVKLLSEADKMEQLIINNFKHICLPHILDHDDHHNTDDLIDCSKLKSTYIKDTIATNTAENFIMVDKFISSTNFTNQLYSKIFVVTSDFHYIRAKKLLDFTIPSNNFECILGKAEYENFRQMESVHILNVESDVNKAKYKFK